MNRNSVTGIRFSARFSIDCRTQDNGTAMRGNSILRTRFSRRISERTAAPVASVKNWNRTMPSSSATPKNGWSPPTFSTSAKTR